MHRFFPNARKSAEQKRKEAEQKKNEGNALFSQQKFVEAAEKYGEAHKLCPDWAVPLVNRALCHKKQQHWELVIKDCEQALEVASQNTKAHYLLGVGLREQGDYERCLRHLKRALQLAREQADSIKDDIWRELAKAQYALWQARSLEEKHDIERLRQRLKLALHALHAQEHLAQGATLYEQHAWDEHAVDKLLHEALRMHSKQELASAYTCELTMEIFREPVVTPSGRSYERTALCEHLQKVGKFDPVTREPMTEADIVPNLQLRAATQQYLEEHPWAWAESF